MENPKKRINRITSRIEKQKKPASPVGPIIAVVLAVILVPVIIVMVGRKSEPAREATVGEKPVQPLELPKIPKQKPAETQKIKVTPEDNGIEKQIEIQHKEELKKQPWPTKTEPKKNELAAKERLELLSDYRAMIAGATALLMDHRYSDALNKYKRFQATRKNIPDNIKSDLDFRMRSAKGLGKLFRKLIKGIHGKKFKSPVNIGKFKNVTLVDADKDGVTVKITHRATTRVKWSTIEPKDIVGLYEHMRLNNKYRLCLAIFCYIHGMDEYGDKVLYVLSKSSDMTDLIFQAIAVARGISPEYPVPDEFVYFNGRWHTSQEFAKVQALRKVENGMYQEEWPNGKKRIVAHCKNSEYHGEYREYFENGKTKLRAHYVAGKLDGTYKKNHESGRLCVSCKYLDGKLHGQYNEFFANGKPKISANYDRGNLHGNYLEFDRSGLIVKEQVYLDGNVLFNRSRDEVKKEVSRLEKEASKCRKVVYDIEPSSSPYRAGRLSIQCQKSALAYLKIYRYLAGSQYKEIVVDNEFCDMAQHAAIMYAVNGSVKNRDKPGDMPEDFYRIAYDGAENSNDYCGSNSDAGHVIDYFLEDPENLDSLGHRRWCLDPDLKKFGFGVFGKYAELCIVDRKRKRRTVNYDYLAFPAKGYHPVKYFGESYAWSVILNRAKYMEPSKGKVTVTISPLSKNFKTLAPLFLDHYDINTEHVAHSYCIIFRPKRIKITAGMRYMVEVTGVKLNSGKPEKIKYVTEFIR